MTNGLDTKFVVLCILDGWGIAAPGSGNAISQATTVNFNKFQASYPHGQLYASGEAVGLPRGESGNTETGHLNIGAGRIVYQDLERINMSIADGTFLNNNALISAINHAKKYNSNLHIMGLIGAGAVHSNLEHLFSLIKLCSLHKFNKVYIHIFTDGRDSPPTASKTYILKLKELIERENTGQIASIMGRYWAMDRDQRWNRTAKAYFALTQGDGKMMVSPEEAIENSYQEGITDEFIEPHLTRGKNGRPIALIKDNDSVIFFNFRIDRAKQLTQAFLLKDFTKSNLYFQRPYFIKPTNHLIIKSEPFNRKILKNLFFVTMTDYGKLLNDSGAYPAFPPEVIDMPLGQVLSTEGIPQLRITESEKERFVTYYFNGFRDRPFQLEERVIIPSPQVPTYDQKPEMSAFELTDTLISKLSTMDYRLAVVNYPNADMVGHTGNIGACVKAIGVVDECLGKLVNFVSAYQGAVVITADHGNAEEMINNQTGQIDTDHSANPVPLIIIARPFLGRPIKLKSGILADIAPTVLALLNLNIPSSMTGHNFLKDIPLS